MLVFWSRHPTIGGPRPDTWRWLAAKVAPEPIYYVTSTRFFGFHIGTIDALKAAGLWP
jgi:hypothetical protein